METTTQTQTQGTPASTDSASSADSNSNAGSQSPQTGMPDEVGTGNTGGKSASSDEDSGAASDGGRQRPGREERRFSELTSRIKSLEAELASKSRLAETLNSAKVDPSAIKFPDYSQMDQVTPEQLKADIINTATQIVDLKMTAAGTALEQKLTQGQAVEKSAMAIEQAISKYPVLNPESDDYDRDLDHEITEAYADVLQRDPSYSFTKFIKPFTRVLEASNSTPQGTSKTEPRGRQANRSSAPTRRSNDFPENGSAADMEKWFANNRG